MVHETDLIIARKGKKKYVSNLQKVLDHSKSRWHLRCYQGEWHAESSAVQAPTLLLVVDAGLLPLKILQQLKSILRW